MKLVSTDKLSEGMIVAKPIYRENGSILVNKGLRLKQRYIDYLKDKGITNLYIEEDLNNKDSNKEVIKIEARNEITSKLKSVLRKVSFSNNIELEKITEIVNNIIDELFSKENILLNLVEIKSIDEYTFGHSVNVCILSIIMGICLGYDREKLTELGIGAILHDIGKLRIPLSILKKPKKLDNDEYKMIKMHTIWGYEILKNNPQVSEASASIALSHHERYDGKGYPNMLKGNSIHEYSRIVAISDVFDALTTDRVYRSKLRTQDAMEYLISMGKSQFDYELVKVFTANVAIYPIGKGVILSTGEKGYVVKNYKSFPSRPAIKVVFDNKGHKMKKPYVIDLINYNNIVIVDIFEDEQCAL